MNCSVIYTPLPSGVSVDDDLFQLDLLTFVNQVRPGLCQKGRRSSSAVLCDRQTDRDSYVSLMSCMAQSYAANSTCNTLQLNDENRTLLALLVVEIVEDKERQGCVL